jgi:hypothetical protein
MFMAAAAATAAAPAAAAAGVESYNNPDPESLTYSQPAQVFASCCSHAQPLASSMVSARSAVVFTWFSLALFRSFLTSLASMLMLATSFTMQATFSFEFSNR